MTYFVLSLCFFYFSIVKIRGKNSESFKADTPFYGGAILIWFSFALSNMKCKILRAIIVSIPWQVMQRPCLFSDLKIGCHIIAPQQSSAMQRMLMAVCSTISWNVPQLTFIAFRAREKSRHFIFYNLNGSTHFHRC